MENKPCAPGKGQKPCEDSLSSKISQCARRCQFRLSAQQPILAAGLFTLILSVFLCVSAVAQDSGTRKLEHNSLTLDVKPVEKWRRSGDFDYVNTLDSLLEHARLHADTVRIDRNTGRKIRNVAARDSLTGSFLAHPVTQAILWLVAIFFIGFIGYHILINNGFFFLRRNKGHDRPPAEPEETGDDMYNRLVAEAEANADFNTATRYLFLQTLKTMSSRELIEFSTHKTNADYISEMKDQPLLEPFRQVTALYEYVWYGEFRLSEEKYLRIRHQFHLFMKQF